MPSLKLTRTSVADLATPDRPVTFWDTGVPGFGIALRPSGARSWVCQYRTGAGGRGATLRRVTLGDPGTVTLEEARAEARTVIARARVGQDTAAERAAEREANRTKAVIEERDTVRALVEQFDRRHLASLKSGRAARAFLDRFIVKEWGTRDVRTITKRDVLDLLDGIADSGRGTTANRVLAHARKFFNWCVEREVIERSPCDKVRPPAKEQARDRVLSDEEVRLFWRACEEAGAPWGPFGRFLLLTGQRLNEAARMTPAEVQGDLWRLAPARTKNGRAHDVPLTHAALAALAEAAPLSGGGFVFTTNGRSPFQGFHKARAALHAGMAKAAAKELPEGAEVPEIAHWTWHDLRRTAATGMARLGVPVRVTEAVLNHVSGTGGGIVAVYQKHDFAAEKRQALEAWAGLVARIVDGTGDNVVPLLKERRA